MHSRFKSDVFFVEGMTCTNCETKIENSLKKITGVQEVTVSYSLSKVAITYDPELIGTSRIVKEIDKQGYTVKVDKTEYKTQGLSKRRESASGDLRIDQLIGILIIIIALYLIINNTVGFNFIPKIEQSMSYGLLFVVGLLTSLHCIAMCGGINVSQCIGYSEEKRETRISKMKPSFLYNLGRVMSYTLIGGIVGTIGSVVSFSGTAKGIVAIVTGLFMVIMGLNMLNIFPWLRRITPRMPKIFGNKVNDNKSGKGPLYIGFLNGLMPCGPLQTMQLYALGTGSFIAGASSMLAFSLGTVPLMFGFGALATLLSKRFTKSMLKVSALLVMVLGFVMLSRGLSLSGISIAFAEPSIEKAAKTGNVAQLQNGIQIVSYDLSSSRYEPIIVQKRIPVRLIINAEQENINGCNNAIIIPKYNLQKALKQGENVIEFTPDEEGAIPYSCWMGMIRSNILVVSDLSQVTSDVIDKAEEGSKGNGGFTPPCCQ